MQINDEEGVSMSWFGLHRRDSLSTFSYPQSMLLIEEYDDKYDLVQEVEWTIPKAITIMDDGDENNQRKSKACQYKIFDRTRYLAKQCIA